MICYPTYFSPISQYVAIAKADKILFEVEDTYQKQSYRTRCYIYGANGKLLLNVPVMQNPKSKKTKNVLLDNATAWRQNHIKAIQSAYSSSPFYEFYEDDFKALFSSETKFLIDFNLDCHAFVMDCLQLELPASKTNIYEKEAYLGFDFRELANAKEKKKFGFVAYTQVFSGKHGFLENLSILDLIFNEGPNALHYLETNVNML